MAPLRKPRALIVIFLLLLLPIGACEEKMERKEEIREETRKEAKEAIGLITTTNYCQGRTTASDVKVRPGYIALSRDLVKKHRLKFGDVIYVGDETEPYVFMDTMPQKWKRHADLFSRSCKNAKEYGVQQRKLWVVRK